MAEMSVIRPPFGRGMISDNRPKHNVLTNKSNLHYGKNQFQTKRRQSFGASCTR